MEEMNLFSQKGFFFLFPRCHDVTSTTTAANPTGLMEIGSYVVLCKDKLDYNMDVSHGMSAVPIRTIWIPSM